MLSTKCGALAALLCLTATSAGTSPETTAPTYCSPVCWESEPCFTSDDCPGLGCGVGMIEDCKFCGFPPYHDCEGAPTSVPTPAGTSPPVAATSPPVAAPTPAGGYCAATCSDAQPCELDESCPGLGCNFGGVEKCRACGYTAGDTTYPACTGGSTPTPSTTTPPVTVTPPTPTTTTPPVTAPTPPAGDYCSPICSSSAPCFMDDTCPGLGCNFAGVAGCRACGYTSGGTTYNDCPDGSGPTPTPPTAAPVAPPTTAPVAPPTTAPVAPPTTAPAAPDTLAPVAPPTTAPVAPPTTAPVAPPTTAPVAPPTTAPVAPPTTAPVAPPTTAPVPPPTTAPVAPPTASPTVGPTPVPTTAAPTLPPQIPPEDGSLPPELMVDVNWKAYGMNYIARKDYTYTLDRCKQPDQIRMEMRILKQVTDRVRIYSLIDAGCFAGRNVWTIAREEGLSVWMGMFTIDDTTFGAEYGELVFMMNEGYITDDNIDMMEGIHISSEAIYRGELTAERTLDYRDAVKDLMVDRGYGDVPVTVADIGDIYLGNPVLFGGVDVVQANSFPFWEPNNINDDVTGAAAYFKTRMDLVFDLADAAGKEVIISETGWASGGTNPGSSTASPENMAQYWRDFYCLAQQEDYKYYWFTAFDSNFARASLTPEGDPNSVEAYFGVFNEDGTIKDFMEFDITC